MIKDFGDTVVMDEDYVASIRPDWDSSRTSPDTSCNDREAKAVDNNDSPHGSPLVAGTTWLS